MNPVENVKLFLESKVYEQLVEEAEYNECAIELMSMIDLSMESILFFQSIDEQTRVTRELKLLTKTLNYIKEIYEEQ